MEISVVATWMWWPSCRGGRGRTPPTPSARPSLSSIWTHSQGYIYLTSSWLDGHCKTSYTEKFRQTQKNVKQSRYPERQRYICTCKENRQRTRNTDTDREWKSLKLGCTHICSGRDMHRHWQVWTQTMGKIDKAPLEGLLPGFALSYSCSQGKYNSQKSIEQNISSKCLHYFVIMVFILSVIWI